MKFIDSYTLSKNRISGVQSNYSHKKNLDNKEPNKSYLRVDFNASVKKQHTWTYHMAPNATV